MNDPAASHKVSKPKGYSTATSCGELSSQKIRESVMKGFFCVYLFIFRSVVLAAILAIAGSAQASILSLHRDNGKDTQVVSSLKNASMTDQNFMGRIMYPTWESVSVGDWRFYARSEFGLYQYDGKNVSHLRENIVRVDQKLLLSDRGITTLIREFGKEYEKVIGIITKREIDCTGRRIHILELTYISDKSSVIKEESYEPIEWDAIIPDSVDSILHQAVCE
jgi:hypothetical protein